VAVAGIGQRKSRVRETRLENVPNTKMPERWAARDSNPDGFPYKPLKRVS
jgi:hypothetical protein